jgi:hypothetical protein
MGYILGSGKIDEEDIENPMVRTNYYEHLEAPLETLVDGELQLLPELFDSMNLHSHSKMLNYGIRSFSGPSVY